MFFFFKQKTAYEMRISDWSSDVCSSDLIRRLRNPGMEILLLPLSEAKENRHVRPYCLANSLDDFRGKTCARLCIAPIAILTQIRFRPQEAVDQISARDRKSTRLNSSH